ncbi:lanthionine synthetase LanC family protein [Cellulomonas sp.]|uniref:lanthionine synthetase LanC family protein n=1 Tax=Cellulomonas sp. TaxID=40001 RepID=UPI001B2A4F06|nr:lanthionine synthetase LanC family protein [Cellulomonas sp.]MBO9553912.1 hypothetical protein [Cellulomonas sp.]
MTTDVLDPAADATSDTITRLRAALDRGIDALTSTAFRSGHRAGWMHWELSGDGTPAGMRAGNPALYDGDVGVAWACGELGAALDRPDLTDLALRVARDAVDRARALGGGLLAGAGGIVLAGRRIEARTGERLPGLEALAVGASHGADVTSGWAGAALAGRAGDEQLARDALTHLERLAHRDASGWSWPERDADRAGRALCGLAHGASGIAWAAAEVAARYPSLVEPASALVRGALRWEGAWFDTARGRWPDLRADPPTHPALWCHGAAGIGTVRLRLLGLAGQGLDLGVPVETLTAEAEVAVQACGQELAASVRLAEQHGPAAIAGGLTLCHGLGGPLDVLLLAGETWSVPEHVAAAQELAGGLLAVLGDEPLTWPAGLPVTGGTSLFLGLAGALLVLARAAHPSAGIASPSLLGVPAPS